MDKLTEKELDALSNADLTKRMDQIITAGAGKLKEKHYTALRFNVTSIMDTKKVKRLDESFQRKIAYTAFGLILQRLYTDLALAPHPPLPGDETVMKQISWAERWQWLAVSSRILFEHFRGLLYAIETGEELGISKKNSQKIKRWLKKPGNKFAYFAISIARAQRYSRLRRDPEVHAGSKLSKKVLMLTADEIDNSYLDLVNLIDNQWQHVLSLANEEQPPGNAVIKDGFNDKEWYELLNTGNQEKIEAKINEMLDDTNQTLR
ncbi:MAG: hypothetical protein WC792_01715 [Candidatus Micrarchaeia archaeon]|jgi:hypothetical protein